MSNLDLFWVDRRATAMLERLGGFSRVILAFTPHGEHDLKGAPGRWSLYRCADDRPGPLVASGYDTDVRHEVPAAPADFVDAARRNRRADRSASTGS